MAKVKYNDQKAVNNRARVRRYRQFRKMKVTHEMYIRKKLNAEEEMPIHEIVEEILDHNKPEIPAPDEITEKIRYWAVQHRITKTALNDLLRILIFAGLNFFPKDARTFMRTPKIVSISTLSKGKLWYNGLKNCLHSSLAQISHDMTITLNFNFDGLPIAKSSNIQFWPILSNIRGMCSVDSSVIDSNTYDLASNFL